MRPPQQAEILIGTPQHQPELLIITDGSPAMQYRPHQLHPQFANVQRPQKFLAQAPDTQIDGIGAAVAISLAGATLSIALAVAARFICVRSVSARELSQPLAPV